MPPGRRGRCLGLPLASRLVTLIVAGAPLLGLGAPHLPGSDKYYVKLKDLTLTQGLLEPHFSPDHTDYELKDPLDSNIKEISVLPELDLAAYEQGETPILDWEDERVKYSPLHQIEVKVNLEKGAGSLRHTYHLRVGDPSEGTFSQYQDYYITIRQGPEERITEAEHIMVRGGGGTLESHPEFNQTSAESSYTFKVGENDDTVTLDVKCNQHATDLYFNGEAMGAIESTKEVTISGAQEMVLVQCVYRKKLYTNKGEMQRTYMVHMLREASISNSNFGLRAANGYGKCSRDEKPNISFTCDNNATEIGLIPYFTNTMASCILTDVKHPYKIIRMVSGLPVFFRRGKGETKYIIMLHAGEEHKREYPLTLTWENPFSQKPHYQGGATLFHPQDVVVLASPSWGEGSCTRFAREFFCEVSSDEVHMTFSWTHDLSVAATLLGPEDEDVSAGLSCKAIPIKSGEKLRRTFKVSIDSIRGPEDMLYNVWLYRALDVLNYEDVRQLSAVNPNEDSSEEARPAALTV